ncbi:MAG: GNAT family N-acetyltransferase [Methanocorpusculum parvum]|nr:GNAT family N-acetyltransferase [Methanocorpusculum parvum]
MSLSIRNAGFSARSLYLQAFPREERFPFLFLKVLALRRSCLFVSYYADDCLVGISYAVEGPEMVFVLYLAVSANVRSRGYGSEILSSLKDLYKKPLTLNIEPLDEDAANAEERKRRFSFYERNGFSNTGYLLQDSQMTYTVLSTAEDFSVEDYTKALLGLHPFGMKMPEIFLQ